jgi:hypothetical protein
MKTLLFALVLLMLLYSSSVNGQCVGSITLSSQAEVNAFPSTHPCTEISAGNDQTGDLFISGSDITNVDSLHSLAKIGGSLIITLSGNLSNINGLNGLTSIGGKLEITNNPHLTNLDGLSSLDTIGYWYVSFESLVISNNAALVSVTGLKSLASVPGSMFIENNTSLPNLNGLEAINFIGLSGIRTGDLYINGNASLTNIDGLSSVHSIGGYYLSSVTISNNPLLLNVNGLSSLTTISGGYTGGLSIRNNASLTNVDGLSSLININNARRYITITDNPNLVRGCALYPILHNYEIVCPTTSQCIKSTITGNGAGFTKEEILANGPCRVVQVQPTALLITNVTAHSMHVSFTAASGTPSGYITLLRAFGSPYPDDAPVDGTVYHVGNTIGANTIVVSVGNQTCFDVASLIPNTKYYLDVFSYNSGYDYLTDNPLAGSQQTADETATPPADPIEQPTNLQFSDVTNTSMTVSFTAPSQAPGGYITLMKTFSSPYPEDVPVNGVNYQVGNVIGSSTIVVGLGSSTNLNIEYLMPSTEYFFDVYSYHIPESGGPQYVANPTEGNQTTASSSSTLAERSAPFPNPFNEEITIPFTINGENASVEIVIYDQMGKQVASVVSQRFDAGSYEVKWNRADNQGTKVNQGLYFYHIKTSESNKSMHGTLVAK